MAIENKLIVVLDLETGDVSKAFKPIEKSAEKAGDKAGKRFGSSFGSALSVAGGVILARGLSSALDGLKNQFSEVVRSAKDLEVVNTQFKTLLGSATKASKVIKDIQDFSANTPFQFDDLANASRQLLAFGTTTDELIPTLGRLGDIASGAGANINELTIPFGRLVASQKLTLIELDKFSDRGINLYAELSRQTGKSFGEIREAISKGQVPFEEFTKAIENLTSKGGKFFNSTAAQSQTLAGALSTLADNVKLAQSELGKLFSPIIKAAAIELTNLFKSLRDSFKDLTFESAVGGISSLVDAGILFIRVFEFAGSIVNAFFDIIKVGVQSVITGFAELAGSGAGLLESLGISNSTTQALQDFAETSKEVLKDLATDSAESLLSIGDTNFADQLQQTSDNILSTALGLKSNLAEATGLSTDDNSEAGGEKESPFDSLGSSASAFFSGLNKGYETSAKAGATFKNGVAALGATIKNSLGKGVGQAFQNVGKALKDGTNAFDAFAAGFKAILGDILSATGDFFIAQGLGFILVDPARGAGLIAAGAGAKLLAGLLGGGSGGGAPASTAPTGSAIDPINTSSEFSDAELTDPDTLESQEPRTEINLVVQGDVFDSQESGTTILKTLNESFQKQGGYFTNSRSVG